MAASSPLVPPCLARGPRTRATGSLRLTRQLLAATLDRMRPRPDSPPPGRPIDDPDPETGAHEAVDPEDADVDEPSLSAARPRPSLTGVGIAGLNRRRVAWILGLVLTAWIVVVFARQVGDASAKASEADAARDTNAEMATMVGSLQRELALVQREEFIEQQAHGLGLGDEKDHPFALAANAPALSANAPGSAAVRLGAHPQEESPLDSWLSLLFGPAPSS